MSSYKAAMEGGDHKRVPDNVAENPTHHGHEFCGIIDEVGANWQHKYKVGQGFANQPAHFYKGSLLAPGYSYPYCGGNAEYGLVPMEILLTDNLLPYDSDVYFYGSLAEPLSCVIGTFHAMYHTTPGSYVHKMGIVEGGKMALLASVGPMGLGAIDYALHCDRRPSLLVVTDIDEARLARAASIYTVEHAKEQGIELHYVNTGKPGYDAAYLRELTGGTGYDDVICFAPCACGEQADAILGFDGCLNFFAGPTNTDFKAELNFYNVHYLYTHLVAPPAATLTTCGSHRDDDLRKDQRRRPGHPHRRPERRGGHHPEPAQHSRRKEADLHPDRPALTAIDDFAKLGRPIPLRRSGGDHRPPQWAGAAKPKSSC